MTQQISKEAAIREATYCANKFKRQYVVLQDKELPSFYSVETAYTYDDKAYMKRYYNLIYRIDP